MSRGTASSEPCEPGLISRERFRQLAGFIFERSDGDSAFVAIRDMECGSTRFANNQITQNVQSRRTEFSVTVSYGQRHGTAASSTLSESSASELLERASAIARVSPIDREHVPPLGSQLYPVVSRVAHSILVGRPERRLRLASVAIDMCLQEGVTAAGVVSSSQAVVGLAAPSGLFAYEPRTDARFSITALTRGAPPVSGWAADVRHCEADLEAEACTRAAIAKALAHQRVRAVPPGRYTVVLEPAAVTGLVGPIIWALDARSYHKGVSAFNGRLGAQLIDPRLSLCNRPLHPELLGFGFDAEGVPAREMVWIDRGVLNELRYSRYVAAEYEVLPSPAPDSPELHGHPGPDIVDLPTVSDLVAAVSVGILVTNFWYIRSVNSNDLTVTGMTRDGTFLIRDGRIVERLVDFRFHDSPLRAFNNVDAFTDTAGAVSNDSWKMLVPAMIVRDFRFSSTSLS